MRVRKKTSTEYAWFSACHRLIRQLEDGELVLERTKDELLFRYVTAPKEGSVLRRGRGCYAAIVDRKDWPYRLVGGLWELAA